MKSTNTCPKCQSKKVVKLKGTSSYSNKIAYGSWGTRYEKVDTYVCMHCGFSERYAQLTSKFLKWANKNLPKDWEVDEDYV